MPKLGPVEVVDYHCAGEPFRIVVSGHPKLGGTSAIERRSYAAQYADDVRQLVVNEPRGHADMFGCFVTPPDDSGADLGVVFFHKDGFSNACGHGTIALATWAIESGKVIPNNGAGQVVIDTPSGRVHAAVSMDSGQVVDVSLVNVPSYVSAHQIPVQLSNDVVGVDVSFGGAFYASVDVADLDLAVAPSNLNAFIARGREIRDVLEGNEAVIHPVDSRLSGLYGIIFYEEIARSDSKLHQRNVTIFADGEVDRSPCGSGTSARLAVLDSLGHLGRGDLLTHESIIGTKFAGRVLSDTQIGGRYGVITEVRGAAFRTGQSTFTLDENDPIGLGFQLR